MPPLLMSGSCIPVLSLFIVPVSRQHCQGNGCGCTSVLSPFIVIVSRQHCQGLVAVPLYSHHSLSLSPDNIVKVWRRLYLCILTIHCCCLQTTLSRSGGCISVLSPFIVIVFRQHCQGLAVTVPLYFHPFIVVVSRQHCQGLAMTVPLYFHPFIVIVSRQPCQCLVAVPLYSHHSLSLSPDNLVKVWQWLYLCTLIVYCHCLQTTLSRLVAVPLYSHSLSLSSDNICQGLTAVPLFSHHSVSLSADNIVNVWWLYLCTLIHHHCLQTTLFKVWQLYLFSLTIHCHCLQTTSLMSGGCTSVLSFIIIVFRQQLSRSGGCTSVLSPFIVIVCRQHCQCLAAVSL